MRSNSANLRLDEFGRLVREGVSDSDSSDSPYRRDEKIERNGYRTSIRRPSPRRRSPWRREERGRQSHRNRRSRSRSPVHWRYNEFSVDKMKNKRFLSYECFNFRKGRCYRGAACRFSHHLTDNGGSLRYTRPQKSYSRSPQSSKSPDLHKSEILSVKEAKDGNVDTQHDFHEEVVSEELIVSSTNIDNDNVDILKSCSLRAADDIIQGNVSKVSVHVVPSRKRYSLSPDPHAHDLQKPLQIFDNYKTPITYQQSHAPSTFSMPESSSVVPPLPPNNLLSGHVTQTTCPDSQGNWQHTVPVLNGSSSHTSVNDPKIILPSDSLIGHLSNNMDSDHALSKFGVMRENHSRFPVKDLYTSHSSSWGQSNSAARLPPVIGCHSSLVGGLASDSNISQGRLSIAQAEFGMQNSTGIVDMEKPAITPYFCQPNQPVVGVGIQQNSYLSALAFNPQMSSEFRSNAFSMEDDAIGSAKYSAPISFSYSLKDISRSALPEMVVSKQQVGDQYDPILDSIEPASISLSKTDQSKQEAIGDSDDIIPTGFGDTLNMEFPNEEDKKSLTVSVSPESGCGTTADVEVGAVSNATTSNTNVDAIGMRIREPEDDHVKVSKRNKSKDLRSIKLFQSSIAKFVKEALKPSWRQGNMSKEAFKTIVKKTIDKVSGAMRRQKIPKSQSKIDRYIESSRGKLTNLVMGYVDKYVKA